MLNAPRNGVTRKSPSRAIFFCVEMVHFSNGLAVGVVLESHRIRAPGPRFFKLTRSTGHLMNGDKASDELTRVPPNGSTARRSTDIAVETGYPRPIRLCRTFRLCAPRMFRGPRFSALLQKKS